MTQSSGMRSSSTYPAGRTDSSTSSVDVEDEGIDVALTPEHCRQLIGAVRVARLGFIDEGLPQMVVLNHLPQGEDVLFQTGEDTRLGALTRDGGEVAAVFEVDSVSASGRTGWSVIGSGLMARDLTHAVATMPVPWRPKATGVLLRLKVTSLTGRQVGAAPQ
jgi:Pyridoxamine 5'-phosphate oxidase